MLNREIKAILEKSRKWGWVLEPDAQKILSLYGFKTPKFGVAATGGEAAVSLADGLTSVAVGVAAQLSIATGRSVTIDEVLS